MQRESLRHSVGAVAKISRLYFEPKSIPQLPYSARFLYPKKNQRGINGWGFLKGRKAPLSKKLIPDGLTNQLTFLRRKGRLILDLVRFEEISPTDLENE